MVLAANSGCLHLANLVKTSHTISAKVSDIRHNRIWTIIGVYGPQGDLEKKIVIRELRHLKQQVRSQWLILGDFNLIYMLQDKNNDRVNRDIMLRFKRAIDYLEIKEINLVGKKYTWSNGQVPPTMSRIDRAFCTPAWEDWHAAPILQACSSSISDHCPLLLTPLISPQVRPRFRFEAFWVDMPGFLETVEEAWNRETPQTLNHLLTLHVKLSRTAKALKSWSKSLLSQCKLNMAIYREVIEQLEKAQEHRSLSPEECCLIKTLKQRLLGLAAIEKSRARQKSRITWLRKRDPNTTFFK
jgi:hypothetical protein